MSKFIKRWRTAVGSRSFVIHLAVTSIALVVLAFTIDNFFAYVQSVQGKRLNDPVLAVIPADDMSVVIFGFIYGAVLMGLVYLVMYPSKLLLAAEAYLFVTLMRMTTLYLFPLEPDGNMVPLSDPFVDRLFYGDQVVTKDLFFSGHVSVLMMLAFVADTFFLKRVFATVAIIVGLSMLIQHAHYTIDIIAAPFFAWISTFIARRFLGRVPATAENAQKNALPN